LQPAVIAAFNSFWKNTEGVQDDFIAMWTHIASQYADDPGVAGYDLFNEPLYGSLLPPIRFDRDYLQPFYQSLIGSIQSRDANHICFFEPTGAVGAGIPCRMTAMNLPNTVYAPHNYAMIPNVFHVYYGNEATIDFIVGAAQHEAERLQVPMWIGEWALFDVTTTNADLYMRDITDLMDEYLAGWCYWVYAKDDNAGLLDPEGNEKEWLLDIVSRTYPQRICGFPMSFSFDVDTARFEMSWSENPQAAGPSVVFIPFQRHYPDGFTVSCSDPKGTWSYTWDDDKNLLMIYADRALPSHSLVIERQ